MGQRRHVVTGRTFFSGPDVLQHSATENNVKVAVGKWQSSSISSQQVYPRKFRPFYPLLRPEASDVNTKRLNPGGGEILNAGTVGASTIHDAHCIR